ncbi:MAG: aminopeptidase [Candidatus Nanohaloarchaeota archaeon QJJ-9]|nr:aminopeptidase [Candidatus Nanohaloarchaeota archaeon QJJ-9]
MSKEKSEMQELEEELSFESKSAWLEDIDEEEVKEFAEDYKEFLSSAKTEREAVEAIRAEADDEGFVSIEDLDSFEEGKKVYAVNREKGIILAKLGEGLEEGAKITISHIDSPRLDLKQKPLYEDSDVAVMDTHYYGGIKNYHWVNVPLALHGVVIDGEGDKHEITIGEEEDDPLFVVPDLLPHLGKEQLKKELKEAIEGEELNIVVGNIPVDDEDVEERVKLQVLKYLDEEYDLGEEDLVSAEFEAVPAIDARDLGFDRSMVASYGQDDRGPSFAALEGILDSEPDKTAIACFYDKEEIGSEGNTSAQGKFVEKFVTELLGLEGVDERYSTMNHVFDSSEVLSADVSAAVNPTFKDVHDQKNAINLGQGVALVKFTGSGGKYSANDANAEFVGKVRRVFNEEDIPWQPVELGKVDKGGGGTLAKFFARRGAEVVDVGFGLLSMHSPYEISSKVDVYSTFKGFRGFFESS